MGKTVKVSFEKTRTCCNFAMYNCVSGYQNNVHKVGSVTKNSRRQELDATFQLCSVDIGTLQCAIVSMVCWQLRVRGDKNLMQLFNFAVWTSVHCNGDITTLECRVHIVVWTSVHCNLDMHTIYCGHHYITMHNCESGYQNIAMYTQWGQYGVLATNNSRMLDATLESRHHYIEMWTSVH